MLWAGILFIWELVGLDLEKAKEAGGNAGAIITAIKSPQAIPWALLILVGYFLFRFTVEWYQSNYSRRSMAVARIDFYSSWLISLLAFALYIGQTVRRVQFANLPTQGKLIFFLVAGSIPVILAVLMRLFAEWFMPGMVRWLKVKARLSKHGE